MGVSLGDRVYHAPSDICGYVVGRSYRFRFPPLVCLAEKSVWAPNENGVWVPEWEIIHHSVSPLHFHRHLHTEQASPGDNHSGIDRVVTELSPRSSPVRCVNLPWIWQHDAMAQAEFLIDQLGNDAASRGDEAVAALGTLLSVVDQEHIVGQSPTVSITTGTHKSGQHTNALATPVINIKFKCKLRTLTFDVSADNIDGFTDEAPKKHAVSGPLNPTTDEGKKLILSLFSDLFFGKEKGVEGPSEPVKTTTA